MLVIFFLWITLSICRGFLPGAHRHVVPRRATLVHFAPVDDFSLLVSAMSEEDRNFEIIKLFAPAVIPFVFITALVAVLLKIIDVQDKKTEEAIKKTDLLIEKNMELNKVAIEKNMELNKVAIEKNMELTQSSIASNKLIADIQSKELRDTTAGQIKAFEAKFDQLYNLISRDISNK